MGITVMMMTTRMSDIQGGKDKRREGNEIRTILSSYMGPVVSFRCMVGNCFGLVNPIELTIS